MSRRINKGGLSTAERIAARERVCERILAMLEKQPMTVAAIMAETGLTDTTACRYLGYLCEMGEVCRSSERAPGNRTIWRLGDDGAPPVKRDQNGAFCGVRIVPARQVGMPRHWLDEAVFGPARAAA